MYKIKAKYVFSLTGYLPLTQGLIVKLTKAAKLWSRHLGIDGHEMVNV